MISFEGGKYNASGLLENMGVRKAKMGSGDKDPAYIMAQNTCLKLVMMLLLIGVSTVTLLGLTIYKVELRSLIAEHLTEQEMVVSRLEERNAHHRLIEAHVSLRTALKGHIAGLQDMAGYYAQMVEEFDRVESALEGVSAAQAPLASLRARFSNLTEGLLAAMADNSRRAVEKLEQMGRVTESEVKRDQIEEAQYHKEMKKRGKDHAELSELESRARGVVEEPGAVESAKGNRGKTLAEKTRVRLAVEALFRWHDDFKLRQSEFHPAMADVEQWKKLEARAQSALLGTGPLSSAQPDKKKLEALQRDMREAMRTAHWVSEGSSGATAGLPGVAREFHAMIEHASVALRVETIDGTHKRYSQNQDAYQAMDSIEALMVQGVIPESVVNRLYSEIRAKEQKCSFVGPYKRTALQGAVDVAAGSKTQFKTLVAATRACQTLDSCGGVTQTAKARYVLRRGSKPTRSKLNEQSWVKRCGKAAAINSKDALDQGRADAISGAFW